MPVLLSSRQRRQIVDEDRQILPQPVQVLVRHRHPPRLVQPDQHRVLGQQALGIGQQAVALGSAACS